MNRSEVKVASNLGTLGSSRSMKCDIDFVNKTEVQYLFTYSFWKGIFDRLFALIILFILSPLLVIIPIMIVLSSPGNPLFRQERVGKDGHKFTFYKFRSMYVNNNDSKYKAFLIKYVHENVVGPTDENGDDIYQLVDDPRVTRFGRLLRRTNLDELPQIINVLKGEMSFIGPRPDITFTVNMYNDHQCKRLAVKPGITGLWQTCGRKRVSFKEMIRRDLYYIKKQSLILDIKILFLTLRTILRGDGS